jgi:hypothetical protein
MNDQEVIPSIAQPTTNRLTQAEASNPNEYQFNSLSVIEFLFKWRWVIVGSTVGAAILAAIFSAPFFIPPKYASTVVFYPSTVNSISKALLSTNDAGDADPLAFGEEEQAEQLLQVLHSESIFDSVTKRYNLMKHYDIDTDDPVRYYKLRKAYDENVQFRRTEYMSVEIKVLDIDPKRAAEMADYIGDLLDATKRAAVRGQALSQLRITNDNYQAKQAFIAEMNDSLQRLRSLGILDYDLQVENLYDEYYKQKGIFEGESGKLASYATSKMSESDTAVVRSRARREGAKRAIAEFEQQFKLLQAYGGRYSIINEQIEEANKEIVAIKDKLDRARVDAQEELPVKFMINSARVSEKKVYPVRWLIVALASLGTFVVVVVGLVGLENYAMLQRRNRKRSMLPL